jgi:hypothetical protein
MSGRLLAAAITALAVGLATANAQPAPNVRAPLKPLSPAGVGGAHVQEAPAQPVPSYAEPLRDPDPVRGRTGAAAAGSTTGAAVAGLGIRLHPDERAAIRHIVRRDDVMARAPECRFGEQVDFTVGRPFPRTSRVCRFPDELSAKVPQSRRYRYLIAGDAIVLIDPNDRHRIVEVIE